MKLAVLIDIADGLYSLGDREFDGGIQSLGIGHIVFLFIDQMN